jgi:hypothetical protein
MVHPFRNGYAKTLQRYAKSGVDIGCEANGKDGLCTLLTKWKALQTLLDCNCVREGDRIS